MHMDDRQPRAGAQAERSWTFARHAPRLASLGYDPIPITRPWDRVTHPGKQPAMPEGWQQGCPREDWRRYASCGVGILSRRTPGIDVDVLDQELGGHIQAFADRHLGEAPIRIGQWPKRLLVFRNDAAPFTKLRLTWRGVGDALHEPTRPPAVEVLADGQQFVVAGLHATTGQPYRWLRDAELSIPRAMLPALDQASAIRFLRALAVVIEDIGATRIKLAGILEPAAERRSSQQPRPSCEGDAERIRAALGRMGNPDLHYDDWIRIGHAIKAELGAGGFELWTWWSSLSAKKNDPDLTRRKWATFNPRGDVTAGTIFYESARS
jgi:hypothetical protein